jgi:hypothetical protein
LCRGWSHAPGCQHANDRARRASDPGHTCCSVELSVWEIETPCSHPKTVTQGTKSFGIIDFAMSLDGCPRGVQPSFGLILRRPSCRSSWKPVRREMVGTARRPQSVSGRVDEPRLPASRPGLGPPVLNELPRYQTKEGIRLCRDTVSCWRPLRWRPVWSAVRTATRAMTSPRPR